MLKDIGYKSYGVLRIRFSQCEKCKEMFPHTTSNRRYLKEHNLEFETPEPMLNGREIYECPYCENTTILPTTSTLSDNLENL